MVLGVGTPLLDISNQAQLLGGQRNSQFQNQRPSSGQSDILDLTPQGRDVLARLQDSQNDLRANDIRFARDRLNQLQQEIGFLRDLLSSAGPEQGEVIRRGIEETGNRLGNLGNQLRGIAQIDQQQISAQLLEGELSASFNAVAEGQGGNLSVSQELNVEFSFLQVSFEEQSTSISITEGENGENIIEVSQTTETTQVTVAQVNVEAEQNISFERPVDPFQELVQDFDNTVTDFLSLIGEAQERLTSEDRIPEGLVTLLRNLLDNPSEFIEGFEVSAPVEQEPAQQGIDQLV